MVESRPGVQERARAGEADELVAWSPERGLRLDVQLELGAKTELLDIVGLGEDRVALAVASGRKAPKLLVGPPAGPFEREVALEGEPIAVDWPADLLWDQAPALTKAAKFSRSTPREPRLGASPFGLAVTSVSSGLVGGLRPPAPEESDEEDPKKKKKKKNTAKKRPKKEPLSFLLQVPSKGLARLEGELTEQGVLVTMLDADHRGVVVHLAEDDGSLLGSWPYRCAAGCVPAALLGEGQAMAFDAESSRLALLSLPTLELQYQTELGARPVDLSVAPDGRRFVLVEPSAVRTGMLIGERLVLAPPHELEMARSPVTAPGRSGYIPAPAQQPPRIVFPTIKRTSPPWEVKVGQELEIPVLVRSGGRAGRGVTIEITGPAIDQELLEATTVTCEDQTGRFARAEGAMVSELPEVGLPCGIALPLDPQPKKAEDKETADEALAATHLDLTLTLRGLVAGSALLTIAVGTTESSTSPLKWTRTLTVD